MQNQDFNFIPRPEAQSMKWNDLLSPLQNAVKDLLVRINGAIKKTDQSEVTLNEYNRANRHGEPSANCFLIYGERGSGKTTVLLSAKEAISNPQDNYFETTSHDATEELRDDDTKEVREAAKKSAEELNKRGVIWLEPLDIEPMPPHANLLTTLLTCIRNALYSPEIKNKTFEHASILDDSNNSARHKINKLIKDATLMWEDIHEMDTRNISNRQIGAADIYAQYKTNFLDAMESLSKEVGYLSGRSDIHHPIILPIDNIDRSTEHLHSIVKLSQLVACPYLWLVLAGDREEIETFLERAYWNELIGMELGGGGVGKKGFGDGNEDEAVAMARRQAAAASHKMLPPSHRISVNLVNPIETLKFCPAAVKTLNNGNHYQTIYELLNNITIPDLGWGYGVSFVDLFDVQRYVNFHNEDNNSSLNTYILEVEKIYYQNKTADEAIELIETRYPLTKQSSVKKRISELNSKYLTQAAHHGLQLPVRGVLDLWQLAHWAVNDGSTSKEKAKFKAEKVATTMLRNIIAESNLSNYYSRWLQYNILDRNPKGATILNFMEPNPSLDIRYIRSFDFEIHTHPIPEFDSLTPHYTVRTTLSTFGYQDVSIFKLRASNARRGKETNSTDKAVQENNDSELLPHLVSSWLSILYDISIWAEKSWVLGSKGSVSKILKNDLVSVTHERIYNKGNLFQQETKILDWPAPEWNNFFICDVFKMRWDEFRSHVRKNKNEPGETCPASLMPQVLAIGWVACILDTDWMLRSPDGATKFEILVKKISELKANGWNNELIDEYEKEVIIDAARHYQTITNADYNSDNEQIYFHGDSHQFIRIWLEQKLPLLLSNLYVPMPKKPRLHKIIDLIKKNQPELATHWENNWSFIVQDVKKTVLEIFSIDETFLDNKSDFLHQTQPYLDNDDLLGPFADMYSYKQDNTIEAD